MCRLATSGPFVFLEPDGLLEFKSLFIIIQDLGGSVVCLAHSLRRPRTEIFNSWLQKDCGNNGGTRRDFFQQKIPLAFNNKYADTQIKKWKSELKNIQFPQKKFHGILKIPLSHSFRLHRDIAIIATWFLREVV